MNLRRGISDLISTVHPEAAQHADGIANKVLNHPLISDSAVSKLDGLASIPVVKSLHESWTLATAIRFEELVGAMEMLAASATKDAKGDLRAPERAMAGIVAKPKRIDKQTETVMAQVGELSKLPQVQLGEVLARIPDAAKVTLGLDLASWFGPAMDRVSQKFAMHSRIITIVVSVVLAFALHLDTFRLWSLFSRDAELRASLVTSSEAMQQAAGRIPQAPVVVPTPGPPAGATERQPGVTPVTNPTAAAGSTTPAGNTPTVNTPSAFAATYHVPAIYRASLTELKQSTGVDVDTSKALQALPDPPDFANREAARAWLETSLRSTSAGVREASLGHFDAIVEKNFAGDTDRLLDRAASVRGVLAGTRFQLIPDPYPGWDYA